MLTATHMHLDKHCCSKGDTFNMIRILSKQKHGLKICHINAQSLPRKIDEFRYLFESSDVDVICVSETWFSDWHNNEVVYVNGYNLFRVDRIDRGGGVAIFVKSGISCKLNCKSLNLSSIEYLFLVITTKSDRILLGCVYRPNKNVNYTQFIDFWKN